MSSLRLSFVPRVTDILTDSTLIVFSALIKLSHWVLGVRRFCLLEADVMYPRPTCRVQRDEGAKQVPSIPSRYFGGALRDCREERGASQTK
jgi:hypothetical protein